MFNRFSSTTPQPQTPQPTANSFFGGAAPAPTASPFGASFASQAPAALPPASAAPSAPYSFTNELENGITIKLLSISAMPAYRHLSQEEIRVDDYMKGRKGPSSFPGSKPGAFSTPFSSNTTANRFPFSSSSTSTGGAFGSSAFGSTPSTSTTSGLFGSSTPQTGGFGTSSTTGFGSTAPSTGGFGSTAPTASTGGFGSFGSTAPQSGAFGSTAPQTGAFGSTNTGNFGSTSGPYGSSTGNLGGFGSSGFGGSTTGGFGSAAAPQSTTGFGGFGTLAAPSTTTAAPSTGAFGSFGGNFGSTAPASSGLFGSTAPASSSSTGGLFGQPPQQQQQQPSAGFGGFGQSITQQPQSTGGLFGAKPPAPAGTGLFGSSAFGTPTTTTGRTGFGGFGQQQQQQQQQPQQGSFGGFGQSTTTATTQPSQSGLFGGSAPSTTGGLFGASTNTTTSNAPMGSSLFGSAPQQQQSTGLFGSSNLFGQSTQPQQQAQSTNMFRPTTQPSSQFSFNAAPSATTPLPATTSTSLFGTSGGLGGGMTSSSNLFNRPTGTSSAVSSAPALPMVAPAPIASGSLSLAPPLPPMYAKPRSEPAQTTQSAPPKSPIKFTPRTSFRIKPRESYNLTTPIPINFGTGPVGTSAGSTVLVPRKMVGSTPNIKKLVIPDFNDSAVSGGVSAPVIASTSVNTSIPSTPFATGGNILTDSMSFGQQYTFPPIKILKTLGPAERKEVKNFVIGQKGVGEIRFLVPVDLSSIDPEAIFGHLIEFCDGEAVLYPDPSIPKPEPGQGLNLPAQVRLERIWTISKGSRDPIVDPENEKVILFTQKLKETEGTNFISYNPSTGTWTFTVDHF